jgi:hypothetical protein
MTPGQKDAIKREMDGAVAFPPIYEMENGVVQVMVPLSFSGRKKFLFPLCIEFEIVTIEPNGRVSRRKTADYTTEENSPK